MSQIQKALRVLGLEPGSSKDAVQRRYKRLIMVWHPDRFPTADGKADAEEELKNINNAKDVLFKHFEDGSHKASGCECQDGAGASAATGSRTGGSSGHTSGASTAEQEAEARRRDEERRRRASQAREQHARKQREAEEAQRRAAANTQTMAEAQRAQAAVKDNSLRWKIAFVEIACYVAILIFAAAGLGLKSWWHDVSWKWQNDNPFMHKDNPPQNNYFNNSTTTNTGYVPPYMVPPTQSSGSNSNVSPYGNTAPPPDNSVAPPPTTNSSTSSPSVPGYNWKPLENPDNPLNTPSGSLGNWKPLGDRLKDNGLGGLQLNTNTSTTTDNSADYNKYINH